MIRTKLKRMLAASLCAALCLSSVPVYAEETPNGQTEVQTDTMQEDVQQDGTEEGSSLNSETSEEPEESQDMTSEEETPPAESQDDVQEETILETQPSEETRPAAEESQEQENSTPETSEETAKAAAQEEQQTKTEETERAAGAHVVYRTHVQDKGWLKEAADGALGGTVGEYKRMEAIEIKLEGVSGGIQYRSHIQKYGWENGWKADGTLSGTEGEAKRLEAMQIRLTGEMAQRFDVYYRVHAEQFGWLGWAKNGESAGTAGFGYRLEGLQVVLVVKGKAAPGSTASAFHQLPSVYYQTHVQNDGWKSEVKDGATGGTVGQYKRMESIKIRLANQDISGNIEYRSHIQNLGWESSWKKNGALSGTTGKSLRLEAIQIRLTGNMAKYFDIYYRVHAQQYGCLGWAKNGASAGTEGCSYRLEAVQIRLVKKGAAAPGSTSRPFVKSKNGWYYENGYKYYYKSGVRQTDIRNIIGKQSSYLIKINKQMSCVTVYAKDGSRGYIIPVVAFACSPGAGTPTGTFHTSDKYRWHALYGAQGQWCTRITGHILFHSLPYTHFNNRTMMPNQYNRLGTWASSGCIRLRAIDAKWIYDNCASGTTVTIYNSSAAGPLGKPVYAKIPAYQNWDPTDPTI